MWRRIAPVWIVGSVAAGACAPFGGSEPPVDVGPPAASVDDAGLGKFGDETTVAPFVGAQDAGADVDASSEDGGDASDPPPGTCPTCPAASSCVHAGCTGSGGGSVSYCSSPVDVASGSYTVFVCPNASTTNLPASCGGGGNYWYVPVRLPAGSWTVALSGINPFVATGTCTDAAACSNATSSVSGTYAGPVLLFLGSIDFLTSCRALTLQIT